MSPHESAISQAQRSQTITSQQTAALLSPALQSLSRQLRSVPPGGAGQGMRLREIVPLAQAQDHALTRLRLTLRNYIIDCSRERSSILIGRDYRCGLVMSDQMASRKHCTIELRGDQFVVQDHEHGKAILLNGEDLSLRRYGWIGFSEARLASSDVVQSSCA